jgi:hypothetical protein
MPEDEWPAIEPDAAREADDPTATRAAADHPATGPGGGSAAVAAVGAAQTDPVTAAIEPAVRRALDHGLSLKNLQRLAAEVAVRISVAEADGSLRVAARQLGVTERALQLRRAAARS